MTDKQAAEEAKKLAKAISITDKILESIGSVEESVNIGDGYTTDELIEDVERIQMILLSVRS